MLKRISKATLVAVILVLVCSCNTYQSVSDNPSSLPGKSRFTSTRGFVGPGDYKPADYAAFGIVAVWGGLDEDVKRLKVICEAYVATIDPSVSIPREKNQQPLSSEMITVWPVKYSRSITIVEPGEGKDRAVAPYGCLKAVPDYDYDEGRRALRLARERGASVEGKGPYLIAWTPGAKTGDLDSKIIISDLSEVATSEEAQKAFRAWINSIETNPEEWPQAGWFEKLRLSLKRIVDRFGSWLEAIFKDHG